MPAVPWTRRGIFACFRIRALARYATCVARGWLVRLFTEDLGAKVLALVIAFVLWATVTFLGTRTLTVESVPVSVTNLRDELALVSEIEPVRVKIRAPRLLLRRQSPAELLRAFVDLAGRGLGAQAADVVVTSADARVDVLTVLPARVTLALDPVVQRSLPVKVVSEGSPADGFRVGETTADPPRVEVRGALGKIQQTPAIEAKVSVQGATARIEGDIPLSPPASLSVAPDRVRVAVEVVQAEETRTLGVRIVTQGTPASGYWIRALTADPPAVAVKGSKEALGDRTFLETVPVNVGGARAPTTQRVDLSLPSGVGVVSGEARVSVRVDVAPLAGTKDVNAAVQMREVPEGLRVTSVSPGSLRVTVQGSGEGFDRLRDDDVRVLLSASGRSAGAFAARPTETDVGVPDGIRVVSVEGVDVTVTLEGT